MHWIQGIVINIHLPYPYLSSFIYTYMTFTSTFPAQFLSWAPDPLIQLPALYLHLLLKGKMGMYSGLSRQTFHKLSHNFTSSIFPNSIPLAKILPSISREIPFSSPYVSLSWDLFQSTTPALFPSLPLFLPKRWKENYLTGEFGKKNIGYNQFPSSSIPSCFLWHPCTSRKHTLSSLMWAL